jgi:hypothetical protein
LTGNDKKEGSFVTSIGLFLYLFIFVFCKVLLLLLLFLLFFSFVSNATRDCHSFALMVMTIIQGLHLLGSSQAMISRKVKEIRLSLWMVIPDCVVSIRSFEMQCLYLYLASPVKTTMDLRAKNTILFT